MWAVPAYPANLHSMECKTAITGNWKKVQECNQINGGGGGCLQATNKTQWDSTAATNRCWLFLMEAGFFTLWRCGDWS